MRAARVAWWAGLMTPLLATLACGDSPFGRPEALGQTPSPTLEATGYIEVLAVIPHADAVWTEGLLVDGGQLWESSGSPSGAGVRALDPRTGQLLWSTSNENQFFAEGIVRAFGRTYVLSLTEGTAFLFDQDADPAFRPFATYGGEGWGLTATRDSLVNSDGSATLFYRDPDTFVIRRTVDISYEGEPVLRLNELEYDGRYIWANQWRTHYIYRIDETNPQNVFRYELPPGFCPSGNPNGIAWDPQEEVFYITGQSCSEIWKVRLR